jgi:hypothetical protein
LKEKYNLHEDDTLPKKRDKSMMEDVKEADETKMPKTEAN